MSTPSISAEVANGTLKSKDREEEEEERKRERELVIGDEAEVGQRGGGGQGVSVIK